MANEGKDLGNLMVITDVDLSENFTSTGITLGHMARLSIQVVIDNTDVAGTISFECSNNNEDWIDLAYIDGDTGDKDETYSVSAGVNVNELFDWSDMGAGFVRIKWVKDAGSTGTMGVWAIRKRV